jgi:hypothetical protein
LITWHCCRRFERAASTLGRQVHYFCNDLKKIPQQSSGTNKRQEKITLPPILKVYFPFPAAFCALTAIQAFVIIPVWCIAMPKLLGDLLPALRKLLQCRQV